MSRSAANSSNLPQRGLGTLLGLAVGDALGVPFDGSPSGIFRHRFPVAVHTGKGEMVGGGPASLQPGEFTQITKNVLVLAESILGTGLEARRADVDRLRPRPAFAGGSAHLEEAIPIGIAGAQHDSPWALVSTEAGELHSDVARVTAEVIRRLITGRDFAEATSEIVSPRSKHTDCAMRDYDAESLTLEQAVWAVRSTTSFEAAVAAAIDLGGRTSTTAALTGALAGARYGIQEIPARWSSIAHGRMRQPDDSERRYGPRDLQAVAHALMGTSERPMIDAEAPVGPTMVDSSGLYAANLAGAQRAGTDFAVVSLCRVDTLDSPHARHREVFIIDGHKDDNPSLDFAVEDAVMSIDAFLDEGLKVVVHCHGGRSRTALVLKAWHMRRHGVDHASAHDWLTRVWPLYSTWNTSFTAFLDHDWSY